MKSNQIYQGLFGWVGWVGRVSWVGCLRWVGRVGCLGGFGSLGCLGGLGWLYDFYNISNTLPKLPNQLRQFWHATYSLIYIVKISLLLYTSLIFHDSYIHS